MVGQRVHPHRHAKVLQIIQELAKVSKLLERDPLLLLDAVQQSIQEHFVLVRVQIRIAQQDLGKVNLGNSYITLRELVELQLEHFRLQIIHELVKTLVVQILVSLAPEKVHLERGVNLVATLQSLLVVDVLAFPNDNEQSRFNWGITTNLINSDAAFILPGADKDLFHLVSFINRKLG